MNQPYVPPISLLAALDSAFLKAIADPARQKIICVLVQNGRLDVNGICQYLTQERSVVSRHLKTLHEADIIASEKIGRHVVYRLNGKSIIQHTEKLLKEVKKMAGVCCP
jgi:DNA-binding transcriptional ArsR family regulator